MQRHVRLLAALCTLQLLGGGARAQALRGLGTTEFSIGSEGNNASQAAFAPHVTLGGGGGAAAGGRTAVVNTTAATAADCSAACRALPECAWWNWCGDQRGCDSGLEPQGCQLLSSNCTLMPPVVARDTGVEQMAGFPIRVVPHTMPGYVTRPALGMQGDDIEECVHGPAVNCTFDSALEAFAACGVLKECRSVVVYENGTDGCSPQLLALLKRSSLSPANTCVATSVYTLELSDVEPLNYYLFVGDATVLLPNMAEQEAALASTGQEWANSTTWLGCIVSDAALMAGDTVAELRRLQTAEECCRACREMEGQCNAWTFCNRTEGCSYQDMQTSVAMARGGCRLQFQQLVQPQLGWPPAVVAKGPGVQYMGGAPLVVTGPDLPGYTRRMGNGLWGQPGYDCAASLTPQLLECALAGSLPELAQHCADDEQCAAFVYKPAGLLLAQGAVAYFRHPVGANLSHAVFTSSSVLYAKSEASSAGAGSSSLSAGAVAGIAVGATAAAVAVAAAAGSWMVRRRRRQQDRNRQQLLPAGGTWVVKGKDSNGLSVGGAALPGTSSASPSAATASGIPTRGVAWLPALATSPFALESQRPLPPSSSRQASSGRQRSPPGSGSMHSGASHSDGGPAYRAGSLAIQGGSIAVPATAAQPGPDEPLILELVQHRARQEEAAASPCRDSSNSIGARLSSDASTEVPACLHDWMIPPHAIQPLLRADGSRQLLGEGASGKVYKALYNGEVVAVKEVNIEAGLASLAFITEASRLQTLRHPNIVSFYGMCVEGCRGQLCTEFCEGRDLHSVLNLCSASSGERLFGWRRRGRRIACEVARALNHLHSKSVVHLDVKSSNVLLSATGTAKLADVGLSRLQTRTVLSDVTAGTFAWAAPEVLMGSGVTKKVDIYSAGVLIYEIITGELPMRGALRLPRVPEECPQAAADLMLECLSPDPAERPTAQQLLQRLEAMLGAPGGA